MQGVQNVFHSASLERKFLGGRPDSVKLNVFNSMQCDANQQKRKRKRNSTTKRKGTTRGSTRGFLRRCQPPAWQRFHGGSERQERRGTAQGQRDGRDLEVGRESATDEKEKEVESSAVLHVLGNGASVDHHSDPRLARQSQQNGNGMVSVTQVPHQCTRRHINTEHRVVTNVHEVAHSSTHVCRRNGLSVNPHQRLRVKPHQCVSCRSGL